MNRFTRILALAILTVVVPPAFAANIQVPIWLHVNVPTGDFEKTHKTGIGVSSAVEFSLAPKLTGHVGYGWTTYDSKESVEGLPFPDDSIDVWEFGAGARYAFGLLYVGLEGDYYTKIDEWGILPEVGVRYLDFDMGVRYKVLGDASWIGIRAGYRFQ